MINYSTPAGCYHALAGVISYNNIKRCALLMKMYAADDGHNDGKRLALPPAAVLWFFRGAHSGRVTVRY